MKTPNSLSQKIRILLLLLKYKTNTKKGFLEIFHFLNVISEINLLFDDILIIWPAPVYIYIY